MSFYVELVDDCMLLGGIRWYVPRPSFGCEKAARCQSRIKMACISTVYADYPLVPVRLMPLMLPCLYAGSVIHYKEMLESFRTEDFILQYRSPNRFRFMGNGRTIREKNGGDLAYYIQ